MAPRAGARVPAGVRAGGQRDGDRALRRERGGRGGPRARGGVLTWGRGDFLRVREDGGDVDLAERDPGGVGQVHRDRHRDPSSSADGGVKGRGISAVVVLLVAIVGVAVFVVV